MQIEAAHLSRLLGNLTEFPLSLGPCPMSFKNFIKMPTADDAELETKTKYFVHFILSNLNAPWQQLLPNTPIKNLFRSAA